MEHFHNTINAVLFLTVGGTSVCGDEDTMGDVGFTSQLPSPPTVTFKICSQLGKHLENNEELENITASLRCHPDVLEVRWQIYAAAKKWDACLDIGKALVAVAPDRSEGWRQRSVAFFLKRTQRIATCLLKFPKDSITHLDMGCYACWLGNLDETRTCLKKAFELEKKQIEQMALGGFGSGLLWTAL